jgi:hypothetical protein
MIDLESGAWEAARARGRELRVVAEALGEGSEAAVADALEALALRGSRGREGAGDVAAAIEGLARADAKALLAYALTMAAEMAIESHAFTEAEQLAARALAAAQPLGKPSAMILAHAVFGRAAHGAGDGQRALSHLEAARAFIDHPYGISKRARDALEQLRALSNAGTNGENHVGDARRKRR